MNASKYYLMMSGVVKPSIMNASKYFLMMLVKLSVFIFNDTFNYFFDIEWVSNTFYC